MKRAINIFSPNWDTADSYGRLASELAKGFEVRGYHVNKFGDGAPNGQFLYPTFGGLFLGYPSNFKQYGDVWGILANRGPRVAITMFESTKLPEFWDVNLNRCDSVIVPANFLVDVFKENGVISPIDVVPLGVSREFFKPKLRTLSPNEPLTFIAIADRGARKAANKALFAFVEAFGNDPNYRLILKSRGKGTQLLNPNVERIERDMTNAELAELYHRAHVMIFPSCGEGFGLPPREFAATGGIALATAWGGTADELGNWGIALPYKISTAWTDKSSWRGKLGDWAEVDHDALVKSLKRVATYFDAYAEDAMKASEFVHENYQWSSFVDGVEKAWLAANEVQYASAG